jgi:putative flippase GtrA
VVALSDMGLYYLLCLAGTDYLWAHTVSRLTGALISFSLNKFITFDNTTLDRTILGRQLSSFIFLFLINATLSALLLMHLTHAARMNPLLAKPLVELVLSLFSFAFMKKRVFAPYA